MDSRFKKIKSLHIESSALCQAYCVQCPRHAEHNLLVKDNNPNISLKSFNSRILPHVDIDTRILFCGNFGDPMMNNETAKMAISAKSKVHNVTVNTNGGVGRPSDYYNMANAGVQLLIDVEGASQEVNERYRRGVSFNHLLANIQAACDGYKDSTENLLVFHVLPWKHTVDDIENIYLLANKYGASIRLVQANGVDSNTALTVTDKDRETTIDALEVYDDANYYEYGMYIHPSSTVYWDNPYLLEDIKNISFKKDIGNKNKTETGVLSKGLSRTREYLMQLDADNTFNTHEQSVEISCYSLNNNELYITHGMIMLPCCWIGLAISGYLDTGKTTRDDQINAMLVSNFLKLNGEDKFNLNNHTFEEILSSHEFNEYTYNHLSGNKVYKYCEEICGLKCEL